MFIPKTGGLSLELDAAMRSELAESLRRLGHRAAALLPANPSPDLIAQQTRQHRVLPGVFGRYYELIEALQAGNRTSAASLWAELGSLTAVPAHFRMCPFAAEALGSDSARYQRLFTRGQEAVGTFSAPEAPEAQRLTALTVEAMALIESVHAPWAQELRALVGEVVFVRVPRGTLSGGSSMMLWGTVLMNSAAVENRIAALSVLAHEATHLLLFGLARREPLTHNAPQESFSTPLRPTPRPMNAVFHATYVSGRLHALCGLLRASGALASAECAEVDDISSLQFERFVQGLAVIHAHGALSPIAQTLIDEAQSALT